VVVGAATPRRQWALHEEGENNEKIDTVGTILIHSANIASSILMQWSQETMFTIVIFKICRQILRFALDPTEALLLDPLGTFVPQAPWFRPRL